MKYIVVECEMLWDAHEWYIHRTLLCITDDYNKYNKRGYEIYAINEDGTLEIMRYSDEN